MYPSKSVPNVLLRLRSTPHTLREPGSSLAYGRPVPGFTRGVQKAAANGSSVSSPPSVHQVVRFFRC